MRDFRNLRVWTASRSLAVDVYAVTRRFPRDERFGLAAQMRSAAVSIGSNIAEGCGRSTPREVARFMSIAAGSASELEFQIDLATELALIENEYGRDLLARIATIRKMLWGLRRSLLSPESDRRSDVG